MVNTNLYKTLDLPGIKIYKSKISDQYFTGLKIEDTPLSVANVTKFTHPDLTLEEYEKIKNTKVSYSMDNKHVDFMMRGQRLQSIRIGSYVMRNMNGMLSIITEQSFKDTFIEIDKDNVNDILMHYFLITVSLMIIAPDKTFHFAQTSIDIKTHNIYPPKKVIIDYARNTLDYIKDMESKGYTIRIDIVNITELTREQMDAYHYETNNED